MEIVPTHIDGVLLIKPKVWGDQRGFFVETWQKDRYEAAGIKFPFVQDNHSKSSYGILRGLHFQRKRPQGKLVSVSLGSVFDVAVDIRKSSPTFGQWIGEILSADNKKQLWIPEGFAHGFVVLSKTAEFLYKTTDYYAPEFERCLAWNDKDIDIKWPINGAALLSGKDQLGKSFAEAEFFS